MSDPNPSTDPRTLLRQVVAAYDALQAAHANHGDDPALVQSATDALRQVMDEARRVANAPRPWRREKRKRS